MLSKILNPFLLFNFLFQETKSKACIRIYNS